MSLDLVHLLILILATDSVMVLWFRGSVFATCRAKAEAWSQLQGCLSWPKRTLGKLLSCPICLPPHLAFWLFLAGTFLPYGKEGLFILASAGAASRLSNDVWELFK